MAWRDKTGVNGVMAARGLLQNPALFAKHYDHTPVECVKEFVDITMRTSLNPTLFHNHLIFMLSNIHSRSGTLVNVMMLVAYYRDLLV